MRCFYFFCTFAKTIATMSNKTLSALKNNNLSSYLGIIGCCVGAALTIAAGAYFSYLLPAGAVIISSIVCVMFAALAFKPTGKFSKPKLPNDSRNKSNKSKSYSKLKNKTSS